MADPKNQPYDNPPQPTRDVDEDENERIRQQRGERDTPIRHSTPGGPEDKMKDHPSPGQPKSRVLPGATYPTTSEPPVQPELAVSLQDGTVPPHTPPTREMPVVSTTKVPGEVSPANAPALHPPLTQKERDAELKRQQTGRE